MSESAAPSAGVAAGCTHCATPLAGRYCHACGQDSVPAETALASWREQWQRLRRTVSALMLRPGLLTQQHLGGARIRYIPPVTLFLNVVAVFFLLSVATEFRMQSFVRQDSTSHLQHSIERRAERAGVSKEVFLERVERRFQGVYTLCVASISLFGYTLLLWLSFRRHWRNWRGPFTLALHYLSFVFLMMPAVMLVVHALSPHVPRAALMTGALATTASLAVAWLALADRRLFAERWPLAVGKGVAIVVTGVFIDQTMFLAAVFITFNLA